MLIDSHFHPQLLAASFNKEQMAQLFTRAQQGQVSTLIAVAITLEDLDYLRALVLAYPQVYYSVGVHPLHLPEEGALPSFTVPADPKCVAVGEIGLDYYHDTSTQSKLRQQQAFRWQLQLALDADKPVIIHNRHAGADILRILAEFKGIRGVLHCFHDTLEVAQGAIEMGFYISFAGIITFTNKSVLPLQAVVKQIPLECILIETDAPYLTPVPWRGLYPNEPHYLLATAQKVCALKEIDFAQGAAALTHNTKTLFALYD